MSYDDLKHPGIRESVGPATAGAEPFGTALKGFENFQGIGGWI